MDKHIIMDALERRKIHNNLGNYLEKIKMLILKVDPKAEIYLFGSVAEKKHTYSSDVDILVVTEENKLKILNELVKEEFTNFFEIHIKKPEEIGWYKKMAKLIRIF